MSQNKNSNGPRNKPTLYAYHVRESGNGSGFWNRIGAVWPNKGGGFTIQLDCIPLDGRIVCQPPKKKEEAPSETTAEQ